MNKGKEHPLTDSQGEEKGNKQMKEKETKTANTTDERGAEKRRPILFLTLPTVKNGQPKQPKKEEEEQ